MEFRELYGNPHKYLAQVEAGQEITLDKNGKPFARLVPYKEKKERSTRSQAPRDEPQESTEE